MQETAGAVVVEMGAMEVPLDLTIPWLQLLA